MVVDSWVSSKVLLASSVGASESSPFRGLYKVVASNHWSDLVHVHDFVNHIFLHQLAHLAYINFLINHIYLYYVLYLQNMRFLLNTCQIPI